MDNSIIREIMRDMDKKIVKEIMQEVFRYMDEHDVYTLTSWDIENVLRKVFS